MSRSPQYRAMRRHRTIIASTMARSRFVVATLACWLLLASGAAAAPLTTRDSRLAGELGAEPAPRSSYVLALTGDTLAHPRVTASALRHAGGDGYDFGPMFAEVSLLLQAVDLALCHLEVPLDPESRLVGGFPRFSAPAELAAGLVEAGFDGCSTASNHTFDQRAQGVLDTLTVLSDAGLGSAGTASRPEDAAGALYDLGGLVVGHSSYSYGFQRQGVPPDRPWLANRIDRDRILADAGELRARGADFVIVSLHWGVEYAGTPNASQRSLAESLLSSADVDLVVGHHPHVLQPIAEFSGKTVLYSLGNFLSNQTSPCCPPESEEGAIVLVRLDAEGGGWKVGAIRHVPTWVNRRNGHVITPALGEAAADSPHRARLARAAERVASDLGPRSVGLSVPEAFRWVLQSVPYRWEAETVTRSAPTRRSPGPSPR